MEKSTLKTLPFPLFGTSNAKTIKGEKNGYLTGVLYLAPHTIATHKPAETVCPFAISAGCATACLYSAGHGRYSTVQSSRVNKTLHFIHNRSEFMENLHYSIKAHVLHAERAGMIPLVRLNGTSDILWERIAYYVNGTRYGSIIDAFPGVQFYDYTKIVSRIERPMPSNYDLTFSYSGLPTFQPYVQRAIHAGARIAAVWRHAHSIPETFHGMPVIHGDDNDLRHTEPQGVFVGLYAKGAAKKDYSGFVID